MESKYNHNEVEPKWIEKWLQSEIYRWDPARPRSETFVVDTPPPTVSGSLHIGHVFSYTQTDVIVRYQRMLGKNIFYPIGWDDNGLATERRVQNYFAIRCEPHLPYDPAWKPVQPQNTEQKAHDISRRNFIEACAVLTREDEVAFERLFKRVGLSYDWSLQYATIDKHCQRISQYSFLDLHSKGFLYQSDAPGMWDVTFKTAVAQAEIEDREIAGAFHDVRFGVEGGGEFIISTTRPELIPACIAVVAHPDDQRYQALFGKTALTPLFHAAVPIHPSPHADPEKGSGIMMVCTFGDIMDVQWWKQSGLPIKQVISPAGTLSKVEYGSGPFQSENKERAKNNYNQLAGLNIKQAQKKIVELLAAPGSSVDGANAALVGDPKPIKHIVKFYEKGDRPIEFIPTRQWFINILDHKEALLEYGRKIAWHPGFMLTRYEHWVQGLNQDWCISRQRYFGVSIPAWYPLSSDGKPDYSKLILPEQQNLPVDPMADCPPGYLPEQRDKPGGFCGDPDVMDTWATSALTPQIQSAWGIDASRHDKLFPMDMRPQAHDIIRTWAFYTVAKAWMHEQKIPWKNAVISGFIMDPDRKKMSKSKGNVVTPEGLINEHSADAVRYWASRARLGMDTAFDESLFKIGRKLSTKIYNASRFVLMQFERVGMKPGNLTPSAISEELDCAMVEELRSAISHATNSFEKFDYASALQNTEDLFWSFCDHYLELVKVRSYSEQDSPHRRSALETLNWSLKTFLRLLAPFMPFVTEEIWAISYASSGRDGSITTSAWPTLEEAADIPRPKDKLSLRAALEVTSKIRGAKTAAQRNLRWEVTGLQVRGPKEHLAALEPVLSDVLLGGNVVPQGERLSVAALPAESTSLFEVEVTLAG